jgi:hypothetical protein
MKCRARHRVRVRCDSALPLPCARFTRSCEEESSVDVSGGPESQRDAPVPDAVRTAAAGRGLGALVDVRREVSMGTAVLRGGGTAAVSVALLVLVSYLAKDESVFSWTYSLLRFAGLFFFFTAFAAFLFAVRGLVVGTREHYLFDGGLVHLRRAGPRTVAWDDVESFSAVYNRRGAGPAAKVLGYQVHAGGRAQFVVPLVLVDGRDPFIDRIIERLQAHGRPVR